MDNIYIGCDLHKRTSSLCIKTQEGRVLEELKIKTTKETFVEALQNYQGAHIVFEPVSQSWWLGDILEEMGLIVYLANAREVKAIAHAKVKNDTIDAKVLCDLLRGNLLPESYRSTKAAREWKELVRFRSSLVSMRTQVKNKVHALLGRNGIIAPLGDIFGKSGRVWLSSLLLSVVHRTHLEQYLALLDTYEEEIMEATRRITALVEGTPEAILLCSVPGISYVSALSIMSEVDTIQRFTNGKKLASYAGLTPRVYASGDSVRYGRLTKSGSKTLRTTMIEVAHAQGRLKRSVGLRPYFERIKERKGARTATVATARKLCVIIHAVLSSQIPFDDTRTVA
jgi:transposase